MTNSHFPDPSLPLIDLHRHLDGSVRLETILDLGRAHNLVLPADDVESLRPFVQVTTPQPGVMSFIEKFTWMTRILVNYDACYRIAYENVADLKTEGIDYAELRFSPWFMAESNHLSSEGVVEAVIAGVDAGQKDFNIPVKLIGILSRTYGPDICMRELQSLLSHKEHITALDLAGDEANYPADWFINHFKIAREAGWHITVHAGESRGPESIWQAINELKADRIGHAVRAYEDPRLIDTLRSRRIPIECNLTSNVQTSTVPDYLSHPLKRFIEDSLVATINTDDPGISAITLPYEYQIAAPAAGLDEEQIRQVQLNALEAAFLSPEEKQKLLLS